MLDSGRFPALRAQIENDAHALGVSRLTGATAPNRGPGVQLLRPRHRRQKCRGVPRGPHSGSDQRPGLSAASARRRSRHHQFGSPRRGAVGSIWTCRAFEWPECRRIRARLLRSRGARQPDLGRSDREHGVQGGRARRGLGQLPAVGRCRFGGVAACANLPAASCATGGRHVPSRRSAHEAWRASPRPDGFGGSNAGAWDHIGWRHTAFASGVRNSADSSAAKL